MTTPHDRAATEAAIAALDAAVREFGLVSAAMVEAVGQAIPALAALERALAGAAAVGLEIDLGAIAGALADDRAKGDAGSAPVGFEPGRLDRLDALLLRAKGLGVLVDLDEPLDLDRLEAALAAGIAAAELGVVVQSVAPADVEAEFVGGVELDRLGGVQS